MVYSMAEWSIQGPPTGDLQAMSDDGRSGFPQPTVVHFGREPARDAPADTETSAIDIAAPSRGGWLYGVAAALSFIWLSTVAGWGWVALGPQAVLALSPLEASALSAGAFSPLAFLWLIVAYVDRGASIRREGEALRRHLALLTYPADASEQRIATIADALRAQSRDLSGATRDAAAQAEGLRLMLSRETRELARLTETVDSDTSKALAKVSEQVNSLHRLMEQVTVLAGEMEGNLGRRQEGLGVAAEKAREAVVSLGDGLAAQARGLEDAAAVLDSRCVSVESLVGRQATILADTRAAAGEFTAAAEALSAKAEAASEALERRVSILDDAGNRMDRTSARMDDEARKALDNVRSLTETLSGSAEVLEERHRRLAETAHSAAQELDAAGVSALSDFNAFRDGASEALEGARAAASAIRDSGQQAENVRRALASGAKGLEQAVTSLADQVHTATLNLSEQTGAIGQTTERAAERLRHLTDILSRNAVEITRTTARSAVEIEQVSESLKSGLGGVQQVVRDVKDAAAIAGAEAQSAARSVREAADAMGQGVAAVADAAETFDGQAIRVTDIANGAVAALTRLGEALREEGQVVLSTADAAAGRALDLQDAFTAAIRTFEDAAQRGAEKVTGQGERLQLAAEVFEHTASRSSEEMAAVGNEVENRTRALGAAARDAVGAIQTVAEAVEANTSGLAKTGARAIDLTRKAGAEFNRNAQTLVAAAREAEEKGKAMEAVTERISVQRFLTETSYAIEKLQAAAVDISRLFSPNVEEELWKRFYKGEQNVFLRHAARTVTRSQAGAVRKMFQQNKEFREYATRYMAQFEALMKAARANERGDVLSAVFTSSDMGRLYMVVARALNRPGPDA